MVISLWKEKERAIDCTNYLCSQLNTCYPINTHYPVNPSLLTLLSFNVLRLPAGLLNAKLSIMLFISIWISLVIRSLVSAGIVSLLLTLLIQSISSWSVIAQSRLWNQSAPGVFLPASSQVLGVDQSWVDRQWPVDTVVLSPALSARLALHPKQY